MKHRDRVLTALNHEVPDRCPMQIAFTPEFANLLVKDMNIDSDKLHNPHGGGNTYELERALGQDMLLTSVGWANSYYQDADAYVDEWGIGWRSAEYETPFGVGRYTEISGNPLADDDAIDSYVPPDPNLPDLYYDALIRQPPIDEENLNPDDNLEEFGPISEQDLNYFEREVKRCYEETDKAVYANFGGTAFGDIALVPAPWLKNPKGIRDITEWYISTAARKDYVYAVFDRQCEIALENLQKIYEVVGNRVHAVFLTGTDFAAQDRPFMSTKTYQELFMPFHKRLNDWIHSNTTWKTFMHTDGAILPLIPSFIEGGFDILNPIQWTAKDMNPKKLKAEFGSDVVFWGGGIDTQGTLPFGTPDDVRKEVLARIEDFAPGGGWVFSTVHNVQPLVPVENLVAMYETINAHRAY